MENTIRTITIHTKMTKKDNTNFPTHAAQIGDTWYQIKFTRTCYGQPLEAGRYDITIDFDECSIERGSIFTRDDGTTGRRNDIIWIKSIVNLHKYTEEEFKEANRADMEAIFGGATK